MGYLVITKADGSQIVLGDELGMNQYARDYGHDYFDKNGKLVRQSDETESAKLGA